MVIKTYVKSKNITDEGTGELDILNIEVVLTSFPIADQEPVESFWKFPFIVNGFINLDLVDLSDEEANNVIIAPDYPLIGNSEGSGFTDSEQTNKSFVLKYYKSISPELLSKIPQFSVKEDFKYTRHSIDIMSNVLKTVTEARELDSSRIPLLEEVVNAIVGAFDKVATYVDQAVVPNSPAPPTPMNTVLTPADTQKITDALQAYSDKDAELRTMLTELTEEVKTFIKGAEENA